MHDALFANQANLAAEHVTELAISLGIDREKFAACMASDRFTTDVEASVSQAESLGIRGTPSFVIGTLQNDGNTVHIDSRFVGAVPYERLSGDLDRLLAGGS
jgi:predicted DsbA family dithiol-disulfide isomerase